MLLFTSLICFLVVVPLYGIGIDLLKIYFPALTQKIEENGKDIERHASNLMDRVRGEINEMMMERSGEPLPPLPGGFNSFQNERCGPIGDDPRTLNGDLCVILQKTCHITEEEFEFARQTLAESFEMFGSDMSVTLITYKDDIQVDIPFQPISGSVLLAIEELEYQKQGRANRFRCEHCQALTYKALEKCREILETEGRDDRYFPNLVISFTDGVTFKNKFNWESERRKTLQEAQALQDMQAVSVVVMFNNTAGSYTGDDEWNALHIPSTVPGVKAVGPIDITDPSAAFGLPDVLRPVLGDDVQQDEVFLPGSQSGFLGQSLFQAFPACPDPCTQFADVALIIDRSDSIPTPDIERVLRFFTFFINESTVDFASGLQFAIFTYNGEVYQHAFLGKHRDKQTLLNIMDAIPRTNAKYTETGKALNLAYRHLLMFNRRGARKTILIASDGRTWPVGFKFTNSRSTIAAASIAKRNNITIYMLGMPNLRGANTGMNEWTRVASEPIGCTIVNMQIPGFNYTHLYLAGVALTNELCKKDDSASKCVFKHTGNYTDEEEQMEP
ncbi:unnamed protein product [Owenia fusiformis]|uniref:Uncharacterized protein n=1 Tax=Owenia fusiformis TaxID=6347 RepID=A0A8J1TU85_OWEFU|nr:unnamed protein product [Owenia fusiformis]